MCVRFVVSRYFTLASLNVKIKKKKLINLYILVLPLKGSQNVFSLFALENFTDACYTKFDNFWPKFKFHNANIEFN